MKIVTSLMVSVFMPCIALAASEKPPFFDKPTEYVVSSPTPTDYTPTDGDISAAITSFDNHLNLTERGDPEQAYATLTPANQKLLGFPEWKELKQKSLADYGVDVARQVSRITWYPNPPSANEPGLFVAMDYAAKTNLGGIDCGYIVLLQQADGSMKVARSEETHIPVDLVEGELPRKDVLEKLPCYLGPDIKTSFPNVGK